MFILWFIHKCIFLGKGGNMRKEDVINYFGTQDKAAKALGVTQASVSRWRVEVPPLRAFEIERLTNGALTVEPLLNGDAEVLQ